MLEIATGKMYDLRRRKPYVAYVTLAVGAPPGPGDKATSQES